MLVTFRANYLIKILAVLSLRKFLDNKGIVLTATMFNFKWLRGFIWHTQWYAIFLKYNGSLKILILPYFIIKMYYRRGISLGSYSTGYGLIQFKSLLIFDSFPRFKLLATTLAFWQYLPVTKQADYHRRPKNPRWLFSKISLVI